MANVIIVIDGEKTIKQKIFNWLESSQYKVVLMGLLDSDKEDRFHAERNNWHDLFGLQEEFEQKGYSVSIGTEKGSIFNIISTVQSLETDLIVLPKSKFLTLATDEYEDFLEQVQCPIILY